MVNVKPHNATHDWIAGIIKIQCGSTKKAVIQIGRRLDVTLLRSACSACSRCRARRWPSWSAWPSPRTSLRLDPLATSTTATRRTSRYSPGSSTRRCLTTSSDRYSQYTSTIAEYVRIQITRSRVSAGDGNSWSVSTVNHPPGALLLASLTSYLFLSWNWPGASAWWHVSYLFFVFRFQPLLV